MTTSTSRWTVSRSEVHSRANQAHPTTDYLSPTLRLHLKKMLLLVLLAANLQYLNSLRPMRNSKALFPLCRHWCAVKASNSTSRYPMKPILLISDVDIASTPYGKIFGDRKDLYGYLRGLVHRMRPSTPPTPLALPFYEYILLYDRPYEAYIRSKPQSTLIAELLSGLCMIALLLVLSTCLQAPYKRLLAAVSHILLPEDYAIFSTPLTYLYYSEEAVELLFSSPEFMLTEDEGEAAVSAVTSPAWKAKDFLGSPVSVNDENSINSADSKSPVCRSGRRNSLRSPLQCVSAAKVPQPATASLSPMLMHLSSSPMVSPFALSPRRAIHLSPRGRMLSPRKARDSPFKSASALIGKFKAIDTTNKIASRKFAKL